MITVLRKSGFGLRILLIFAVPMFCVVLGLGYYFTSLQMNDARSMLLNRGAMMAKHLAELSEFGLFSKDPVELQRQAGSILRDPGALCVKIRDSNGDLLINIDRAGSGYDDDQIMTFAAGVVRTGVDVLDFETDTGGMTDAGPQKRIGAVEIGLSTARMEQRRYTILMTGIALTAAGLLISMLLAYFVARNITEPVIRLRNVVTELTGGRLSARSAADSPGELGSLEHGINQMAETLQDAHNRLQNEVEQATIALQDTVRKLENRNEQLDQARNDAISAGAAKSEFLARMSHEIRTPLSAIIGFSELLKKTGLADSQQEYIHTITQAASQLLQIIDDILGYTRLDSNNLVLDRVSFDLHEMLENVVSILSVMAHEKRLELVLNIHSDVPQHVNTDPNRVSQILTNLVNNAIKFTQAGHVIVEVSVADTDAGMATINFAVTDTGIGLSGSQQQHIFEPFLQADASISRQYGGAGLGLSICKKLVELLDGDIGVTSQPGKGTTFSFTIKVPYESSPSLQARKPLAGKKVLVYDRNPFTLRALRNRFLIWGATVFITSDRARLQDMLVENAHRGSANDLLVMGLSHEEYDGIARDAWLADIRRVCSTPAMVLIGDELIDQPACLVGNRMCILSKPPRSERLLRTIRTMLPTADIRDTGRPAAAAGLPADEKIPCLNVLVAEDNQFNQQLFTSLLGNLGINTTLATNGEEACRLAEQTLYDLILMDIHMPVMGGVRATQQIRQGLNRLTPVIALTADVFADSDNYLGSIGLDDILYKPVSEQKLHDILCKWCVPAEQLSEGSSQKAVQLPPGFLKRLNREMIRLLHQLQEAADKGDRKALEDQLHQLKGLAGYFGTGEIVTCLASLEKACATGSAPSIHAALERLEGLVRETGTAGE